MRSLAALLVFLAVSCNDEEYVCGTGDGAVVCETDEVCCQPDCSVEEFICIGHGEGACTLRACD